MNKYARIYEGRVAELFDTDGVITELFHPDLIWVDTTAIAPQPQEGWTATMAADSNWIFAPYVEPSLTDEQLIANANRQRDLLLATATLRIAPLQDAIDLGEATDEEKSLLSAWKQYRVGLIRIEQQVGFPASIDWPITPAV
ncbi:tail fiber assembly protein [Pseudomonas lini]